MVSTTCRTSILGVALQGQRIVQRQSLVMRVPRAAGEHAVQQPCTCSP